MYLNMFLYSIYTNFRTDLPILLASNFSRPQQNTGMLFIADSWALSFHAAFYLPSFPFYRELYGGNPTPTFEEAVKN